ncbi:MAG: DUF294 nucleotidyltransferase-like domain-containing protein [Gammaproteobacteria bacterium]|nr:DUF294 nucleotidyltransferase-like domain-containing protein [Gammaproteobacteria bacterium]
MEIEQLEIRDYLSQCAPLDKLDPAELDKVIHALEITYVRRNRELLTIGGTNHTLFLIRSGAMAVFDEHDELQGQYTDGDWVGYRSVLKGGEITLSVKAMEDSLLYCIPGSIFLPLYEKHEYLQHYFSRQKPARLRSAIEEIRDLQHNPLVSTHVRELVHGQPLMVDESTSIRQVAEKMTRTGYTVCLITRDNKLTGIVTDRAYCTKVVARELSLDTPVTEIMTQNPRTIPANSLGSDALLMMARNNIRHLPVVEQGDVVGVITATDLIRRQSHNAIYLINEIYRAKDVDELETLSQQLPNTLLSLVQNSLTAYDIGHAISSIGEAITQRLLQIAEKQLGPAPVPYAWVMAGSLARYEQTAYSDQDNALFLSDDYEENAHGVYFEQLSQFVSDGLNQCGYHYCPGDVMATNPKWRQPVSVWQRYFNEWIEEPEPMALMYSSIFFDLRCVYGEASLLENIRTEVLKKTQKNTIFLGHLLANALQFHPPIGFFRNFVLEKTGEEEKALDFKKRGVIPITDLARFFALSAGHPALHTQDRLEAAAEAGLLSHDGMEDLRDALEFIGTTRLQHQAWQILNDEELDNFVSPEQLSSLERRHLKDAFDVVRTIQSVMAQRY